MYQVSNSFLQAMDDISRTLAVEVEISGVRYPTDAIIRFELERGVFDNDTFTIGQTMSNALTLEIFTTPTIQTGDEIKLFTSLRVGEKDERVPLGVYYVDSATVNKEKMTLTCYDKMVTFVDEYIPSANHTTLAALFEDVISQIGMRYEGVFHDAPIKGSLYGYTHRETLGFIASLNGGNMVVNRAGHLEIQRSQTVERSIPAKACFSFDVKESYRVSKVFCQFGDVGITRGDSSGQCVAFENPYVTEQNIDAIYNQLNGLSFTAATLNYRGDLTLDPGDIFQFTDYKGDTYPLMCGRNKLTFNGGLSGQLDSIGESENANNYVESQLKYKKNLTKVTAELGKIQAVVQEIEQSHDGLEERVERAELEITADAIKSKVENHFVAKDEINGLVTEERLQSAITQSADSINAQVSTKYETKANVETKINDAIDDVQVGGANLWSETAWIDGAIMGDGTVSDYWLRPHVSYPDFVSVGNNKYITYQCWNPNGIVNNTNYNRIAFYDLDKTLLGSVDVPILNGEPYQCATWEILSGTKYIRFGVISDVGGGGYNTSLKFKFEFGNKPTEWSPNALDIANNITTAKNDAITSANNNTATVLKSYYTKEETNSQINVAKNEINLGVSNIKTEMMSASYNNLLWNSDFLIDDESGYFYKGYERTSSQHVSKGDWVCPQGGKTVLVYTIGTGTTWQGFRTPGVKVNKDQQLTASVYVATDNYEAIDANLGMEIEWYGADGNRISTSGHTFRPTENHKWYRISATGVAPEGAVMADIYCWNEYQATSWWGKPMLQFGSVCTAWDRGGDFDNINERLSNAELKITDDAIIASVSGVYETKTEVTNKIEALDFDNTNYVRNGGFSKGLDYYDSNGGEFQVIDAHEVSLTGKAVQIRGSQYQGIYQSILNASSGDYTVSFCLRTPCENPVRMYSKWESFSEDNFFTATNEWTRVSYNVSKYNGDMKAVIFYMWENSENNNIIQIHSIKVEKGNKATQWTPNPLDVENSIDTAKNDAITSANNTLTTTIANYYTKEETNSQINIAKDEIKLGVSQTYETKATVETKINGAVNGIKIGGTNLITKKSGYTLGYIEPANGQEMNSGLSLNANQDFYTNEYFFLKQGSPVTLTSYPKQGITSTFQNAVNIHVYTMDKVWQWGSGAVVNPNEIATATYVAVSDCYVRFTARGFNDYNHMAEFSNKPSEWSPSPKDIDVVIDTKANSADVYTKSEVYTKNETNSQINVAKNEVTTTVSNLRTEVMSASYENLLWNSDFLILENNFPKGYYSTDSSKCYLGGWICPDGGRTIIIDTPSGGGWTGFKSSGVRARQDQVFTASVYIAIEKEEYKGTVTFGLELEWFGSDGNRIAVSGKEFTVDSRYTWVRQSVTGTAPSGTASVGVFCWNKATGIAWWGKPMLQLGSTMTAWTRGGDFEKVDERLSYAESKITDTAITNTVKQNFYTKEETNNQITSKGYQTESQVQQTVNAVKFSFQESGGYNLLKNSKWDAKKEQWTFTNDSYVSVIEDAAAGTNYLRCQTVNGATHGCSQTIKVEKDNTYVASAKVDFDNGAIAVLRVQVNGSTYYAKTNQASQYRNKVLFVSFPVTTSGDAVITLYTDNSSTTGKYARFRYSQVELGSEFSPWSPNPYEIYGGVATIDKDKVRIQHDNGSYSQMAVSGFKRFDSGTGRDYHYLSSNGVIKVSNGTPVTVTLPSEFKGKDFKVTLSIFKVNIPSGVGWNGIYDIDSYTSNVDRGNAKFTVEAMVKSVNGQYGTVDISYVVIA